jgi:cytoskeletal protein CcmA (bactofilin family)
MNRLLALALLSLATSIAQAQNAGITTVSSSIDVRPGEHTGDAMTVSGSVKIGEHAVVGHAHTVSGSIDLARGVTAASLSTVSGSVHVGEEDRIAGSVSTVSGSLQIAPGADITGSLSNVSGEILVRAAHVGGQIKTVSGNIEIGPDSRVEGDVIVEPDDSWFHSSGRAPRIIIGPGSVVSGTLTFKRDVKLYVSDRAQVGTIVGATAERFSGARPPS